MNLTWTCHVCHEERPDERISVLSTTKMLESDIPVQMNVRYCNDRPACIDGARSVDFLSPPKDVQDMRPEPMHDPHEECQDQIARLKDYLFFARFGAALFLAVIIGIFLLFLLWLAATYCGG